MHPLHPSRLQRWRFTLFATVIAAIAAAPAPSPVTVKGDVDVKSDKSPLADPVETVPTGTKLDVIDTDGGWIHVRTPSGKVGFITQDDLPANIDVAAVTGSGTATNLDSTASIKGNQVEDYAKQKNLKLDGLNQMIAIGDAVTSKDLRDFAKAGHVGPAKFRK